MVAGGHASRGWTEIENISELLKRCCNYLCFLKNYVSESRSPDRPHFAAVQRSVLPLLFSMR